MSVAELTETDDRTGRGAALVSATGLVVAGANYVFSLVLVHVLVASDYVAYASVQSLLLVLGSGAMAAVPWAVARHVATSTSAAAAGEALGFGLLAASAQGLLFAAFAFAVVAPTSGTTLALTAAVAAWTLSIVVAPLGVLQGQGRMGALSGLRLMETAVRLGLSAWLLVAFAAAPTSPVLGFAVGSAVLFVTAMVLVRGALPLRRGSFAQLTRRSLWLGAVQICLAALGVVDTVVIATAQFPVPDAAAYQVAALLGRVPLFVASGVALAYYAAIATGTSAHARDVLRRAVRLLVLLVAPAALLMCTAPSWSLTLLAGDSAPTVRELLTVTVSAGLCVAVVTVLATALQARDEHASILLVVVPAVLVQLVGLSWVGRGHAVGWYAAFNCAVLILTAVVATIRMRAWKPWQGLTRWDLTGLGAVAVLAAGGLWLAWLWWCAVAIAGVLVARTAASR